MWVHKLNSNLYLENCRFKVKIQSPPIYTLPSSSNRLVIPYPPILRQSPSAEVNNANVPNFTEYILVFVFTFALFHLPVTLYPSTTFLSTIPPSRSIRRNRKYCLPRIGRGGVSKKMSSSIATTQVLRKWPKGMLGLGQDEGTP